MLEIFQLGPEDATRAQANCALFWDMSAADDNLNAYLKDPNCLLLVAEIDGEPVGQIVGYLLQRWDSKRPKLFLYSIDVVASHRRQGIARRLLEALLRIGEDAGSGSVFVITSESNTAAMHLYPVLGGTRINPDDVMFEWER